MGYLNKVVFWCFCYILVKIKFDVKTGSRINKKQTNDPSAGPSAPAGASKKVFNFDLCCKGSDECFLEIPGSENQGIRGKTIYHPGIFSLLFYGVCLTWIKFYVKADQLMSQMTDARSGSGVRVVELRTNVSTLYYYLISIII